MKEEIQNGVHASESKTEQTYILMPQHLNSVGRLFGGQLLSWIDMTAGIVARRHTKSNVVTVAIDNLCFKDSAEKSDIVTLVGEVTYTGNTSMEVRVDTYKEKSGGEKIHINRAYLVMVAVDEVTKRPKRIPPVILDTEEQKVEWEAAVLRAQLRKKRREEGF